MYVDTPSRATRDLVRELIESDNENATILDYGAGNGRNAYYIDDQVPAFVLAYDPYVHKKSLFPTLVKIDGIKHLEFDYVLCSFVANTLPREAREHMFEALSQLHYQNLIIEVRSIADVEKIKNTFRRSDGYVTSRNTFQRGFEPADISRLNDFFGEHGMLYTKTHHALSFIWREELR